MNNHRRVRYLQALQIPQWSRRKELQIVSPSESSADELEKVPVETAVNVEPAPVSEEVSAITADTQVLHKSSDTPESEFKGEPKAEALDDKPVEQAIAKPKIILQGQGDSQASCIVLGHIAVAEESDHAFSAEEQALLVNMLKAIQLTPSDVFTVKPTQCLGSALRDPQQSELEECREYLLGHIRQINPKVVFVMNQLTAQILLQTEQTLAQLRERQHDITGLSAKLIVSYTPAHLLKRTQDKAKAWQDLKQLRHQLQQG